MTPGERNIRALVNVAMVQTFSWKTVAAAPGVNLPVSMSGYTARNIVIDSAGAATLKLTTVTGVVESYAVVITPVDTTGYSARHVVTTSAGVALINLTTQAGAVVLTPASGKIESTFSRAAMLVAPGEHTHLLVLTSPAGLDYPLAAGRFSVARGLPV